LVKERQKTFKFYLFALALLISVVLVYLALPDAQSSVAEATPTVIELEATQPADWEEILLAGSVLHQRLRLWYPQSSGFLDWESKGNRLIVSIPPDVPVDWVVTEANRVGLVEIVEGGTEYVPLGSVVETGPQAEPANGVYQAVLEPDHFAAVDARLGKNGQPVIEFVLTPAGDALLADHTARQRGYYLCLALDGQIVNCPILRTPLKNRRGAIELTGEAGLDDARILAMLLRSGPLPVPLRLVAN
jgi:hypothetical protein